jgi:hypothetical protein
VDRAFHARCVPNARSAPFKIGLAELAFVFPSRMECPIHLLRLYTGGFPWDQLNVRFSPVIPVIFLCCAVARAQDMSPRWNSIVNPDKDPTTSMQKKTYYGGKSFQQTGPAYTKDFYYTEHYSPKSFSTRSYYGATPYSTGKFATNGANTKGEYEIPNAAKKADTKTAETKESSDSRKLYATRDYTTREYRGSEAQHLKTSLKGEPEVGSLKPMTVDQVRDLLNKNK